MTALVLHGLDGTNPLGFLAALGVLSVPPENGGEQSRLAWTEGIVPYPIVEGHDSIDALADAIVAERDQWRGATVLRFPSGSAPLDDLKLSPEELHHYVTECAQADDGGRSAALCAALVAEGARQQDGAAQPTNLYFTAGKQHFLQMARQIVDGLERAHVIEALAGPWTYRSKLPSFKWDVTDDRVYATSAVNPEDEKKPTIPGAEFLAFLGLRALPTFADGARAITTACAGRAGDFTWPLWSELVSFPVARTLLAHASSDNERWLRGWTVRSLVSCHIRRSEKGGYGSFSPPSMVWSA